MIRDGHDSQCESELTSHGYTPCRCQQRVLPWCGGTGFIAIPSSSPGPPEGEVCPGCPQCEQSQADGEQS